MAAPFDIDLERVEAHAARLSRLGDPLSDDRAALETQLGMRRFRAFFKMAWPRIDPAYLLWNWHIDLLCDEMEKVARREVTEAVYCVPPRSLKSQIMSVAFPAWVWTWNPAAKFITGSNEMTLATRDAVRMRALIKSEWYQRRWGAGSRFLRDVRVSNGDPHPGVAITSDQDNKTYFETHAGGHRFCCTPGSNVTGHGGDFVLCLPGDQVVLTDRGHQTIEQVVTERAAKTVLAFDHDVGRALFRPILDFEVHPAREMVEIEADDGRVLRCTVDHPVWVEGMGYIPAGTVQPDDVVLTCRAASIE